MPRFHCRARNGSVRNGAVGRGRYSPAQFRGRVSTADSTLYGRPDVDRRGSYVNTSSSPRMQRNVSTSLFAQASVLRDMLIVKNNTSRLLFVCFYPHVARK